MNADPTTTVAQRLALCPFGVLVGGTRERHLDGTSFEPQKLPENAAPPTSRSVAKVCMLRWAATLSHTSLSDKQLPIVVTFLCIFASRTGYPIHAGNIVLPKHQTQLRSMFLNMSHTVQLKLQEARFHPLEYATLLRSLVC